MRWRVLGVLVSLVIGVANSQSASAAVAEGQQGITRVVLATSGGAVDFRDASQSDPPAIVIDFRSRNVVSELEPVMSVESGLIKEIRVVYHRGWVGKRALKSVTLMLSQSALYEIGQVGDQIVVDIETPLSLLPGRIVIGDGVTILGIEGQEAMLLRFKAMGEVLQQVSRPAASLTTEREPVVVTTSAIYEPVVGPQAVPSVPIPRRGGGGVWLGLMLGAGGAMAASAWRRKGRRAVIAGVAQPALQRGVASSSGTSTIFEQLVLAAIERQGQPVTGLRPVPGVGMLWKINEEHNRHGIICIGDGSLLGRKVLEDFSEALKQEALPSGIVVALVGATAPAQVFAKERAIHLMPRDEVFNLIEGELRSAAGEEEIGALRRRLAGSEGGLARTQDRLKILKEELASHAELKRESDATRETLEKQATILKNKRQTSETRVSDMQAERERYKKQVDEFGVTVSSKEAELAEQRQRVIAMSEEIKGMSRKTEGLLKERADAYEQQLLDERAKREELASEIARLKKALAEKERQGVTGGVVAGGQETHKDADVGDVDAPARKARERARETKPRQRFRAKARQTASLIDLGPLGEKGLVVRINRDGKEGTPFLGVAKHLGAKTLVVEGSTELRPADAVSLELFVFDSLVPIEVRGRVLRQQPDTDGSQARTEISITPRSPVNRALLARYLKQVQATLSSPAKGMTEGDADG